MRTQALMAAVFSVVSVVSSVTSAETKIDEQMVGPASAQGGNYTVSEHGLHLAIVGMKGSRFVVTVDGVEGPKFDEVYNAAGKIVADVRDDGYVSSARFDAFGAVAFSPDGTRYAYCAREGKDLVVIVDGKELYRTPYSSGRAPVSLISFTPDGKHVFFMIPTMDTMMSVSILFDGKPGPAMHEAAYPVFSPDGSRYAYNAPTPRAPEKKTLIVDGQSAGYEGYRLKFTPDSKRLVSVKYQQPNGMGQQTLQVDGRPMLTANAISAVAFSPTSERIAAVPITKVGTNAVYIDGQLVPGTEGAYGSVIFSPDGKRWAVSCYSNPAAYVVVDGKKQQEYKGISNLMFTADSSKVIYVAQAGDKKFVVVDGEESEGNYVVTLGPVVSRQGAHYAYALGRMAGDLHAVVDGKPLPKTWIVDALYFSPDGSRSAVVASPDALSKSLMVDGEAQPGAIRGTPMFSPDSKYFAVPFAPAQINKAAGPVLKSGERLLFNNRIVRTEPNVGRVELLAFTPDSRHVVWRGEQNMKDKNVHSIFLDGTSVAQFDQFARGLPGRAVMFEMLPDGSFLMLGKSGDSFKRLTVTPSSDTSIAKLFADQDAEEAKAKADAEAAAAASAQKKADDEAVRKKAIEEAAQKKKEALEARQRAREEAIRKKAEAKKKK